MGRQFNISAMGLKLVKAYEGYRPVDKTLVSGQRVIGYGHRIFDDEPKFLSKPEAEELLKEDLAPFEDMINENVHAPLTQSQFDALCSFAYNIGPKAFLKSDTLRALNNGRPLDAANGFDIWRKSEIDGKTYVVDALMRRRTAEKALFLRPEGSPVSAPRVDLPPVADETVALLSTEDALPVFTKDDSAGVVGTVPYDAAPQQMRRREDGPAGILALSEVYDENDVYEDDMPFDPDPVVDEAEDTSPSLIAIEDEKLKDRLDALIEGVKGEQKAVDTSEWPESLIKAEPAGDNIVDFKPETQTDQDNGTVDLVIDNLREDDALRPRSDDSASKYIDMGTEQPAVQTTTLPYWIMIFLGSILFGGSLAAYFKGAKALMGEYGPLISISGILIGGMMLLGALFYAIRQTFRS